MKSNKLSLFLNQRKFILLTFFPLLFLILYFYKIGRPRFFVRSDVVVRKAAEDGYSNYFLGGILGSGNQSSLEDARYLRTYLESPQVLEDLEKKINFKQLYQKKGLDFYAGLSKNHNSIERYKFFRKLVSITLKESSGILTIRTIAYDPNTSFEFNKFLIEQSEKFVNALNQDIYKRQLDFVNTQVENQSDEVKNLYDKLAFFQKENEIFNIDIETNLMSQYLSALESELVRIKVEKGKLLSIYVNEDEPVIEELNNHINLLEEQIKKERKNLFSEDGKNINDKMVFIEKIKTDLSFARDLYVSALTAAEQTRIDSLRQQRFMAILSKPDLPDTQWNYWRHKGILTSLTIILVSVLLVKFIQGMLDSHND